MSTYYIDYKNGNDTTGNGSSALPYKTLTKALSVTGNSDTVYVRGTYTDNTTWYRECGMTCSDNSVTIAADAGHTPVFVATHEYTSWAATVGQTKVYEAAYVATACWAVWNGTTLLTTVGSIAACEAANNSRYFDNAGDKLYVNIGGAAPTSIEAYDVGNNFALIVTGTGVILSGLYFWYQMQAVDIRAGTSTTQNCILARWFSFSSGVTANFVLLQLAGTTHAVTGCTFTGGYIDTSHCTAIIRGAATGEGIAVSNCTFSSGYAGVYTVGGTHTVSDCTFTGVSNSSVWPAAGTITVTGCTATDNGHDGFGCTAGATLNADHCIVNYTSDVAAPTTGSLYGFVIHGSAALYHCVAANLRRTTKGALVGFDVATTEPVTIKNCISYYNGAGIDDTSDDTPPAGGWDADYNCIYSCTTAYGTGYSAGAHDIATDPQFVSTVAGSDDFGLLPGSGCRYTGVYVAGVSEYGLPSRGRYEYAVPASASLPRHGGHRML